MFKEYLLSNGADIFGDISIKNNVKDVCMSFQCADVLENVLKNKSFEGISEEQAKLLLKDFVEPVAYGDNKNTAYNPKYSYITDVCRRLWTSAPSNIKNAIYSNT